MAANFVRLCVAALLSLTLGYRGYKKQSLDFSGAVSAFIVGLFTLASGYRFGLLLLGFYFSGSKLTKLKANLKVNMDENYKIGGQRSAMQVLACSILATGIAVNYTTQFGDQDIKIDFQSAPWASYLLTSYIGHYACCAADTWASELGVLSKHDPWLITTFKSVPRGTNGGVSALGLFASVLGGGMMGLLYFVASLFTSTAQVQVIVLGAFTGLFGSVLDSLLGATLQATWFNRKTNKICAEETNFNRNNGLDTNLLHISGINLLTNAQVNGVSVLVTTLASGQLAQLIFP